MPAKPLRVGDVVTARFPESRPTGHEQDGIRPAVIVGLPERIGIPRFRTILLAPMTTARQQLWATQSPDLYPFLTAGTAGLPSDSLVLLDQIRALDFSRLMRRVGSLSRAEFAIIHHGFERMTRP
jgi:mRNA interferase MazF